MGNLVQVDFSYKKGDDFYEAVRSNCNTHIGDPDRENSDSDLAYVDEVVGSRVVYHLGGATIKVFSRVHVAGGLCIAETRKKAIGALEQLEDIVGYKVIIKGGRK